jgi:predicted GIY-YIG superfamily endonuclease
VGYTNLDGEWIPLVLSLSKDERSAAMPFWTYILKCADGSYYVGHTDDLEERIARHTTARSAATR